MNWALKGLAGPLKNKTFPLKPGLTLGRQGQVVIPDTKASSIHARINENASGLVLEDNSSKNGTRINGERITEVQLRPGLVFWIGDQSFEVIDLSEKVAPAPVPPPAPQPKAPAVESPQEKAPLPPMTAVPDLEVPAPAPVPPPPPPEKVKRYWHELLAEFLTGHQDKFEERMRPVSSLNPAVILEFVRGVQVNVRWTLGYGPRKVGSNSLDLPIWEPGAPAVCFEILPSLDGIVFKTSHPDVVTVNGEGVDSQVLRVGDTICINETLIEVDFTE